MNFFKKFPTLSILLAGSLWGLTGIFVRTLNDSGLDNMQLLFFRSFLTTLVLGVYLLFSDKKKFKIHIKDCRYFFGTGILSFLFFGFAYFYTINHASMPVAAVLLYTAPFFVMLMAAIFFKEKITTVKIIALIMAVAGCLFICGTDMNTHLTPFVIFTGVASGFCYALYSIFGRVALKKYPSSTVTFYTFLFSMIGSLFVVDFGKIHTAFSRNPKIIFLTGLFAVVSAVLPYVFYTNGLKYTDAGKASIISTIEAVVAALCGIFVFGESITPLGIIGMLLVISAIVIINRKSV